MIGKNVGKMDKRLDQAASMMYTEYKADTELQKLLGKWWIS